MVQGIYLPLCHKKFNKLLNYHEENYVFLGAAFFVLITDCYVEKAQKREIISDIAMENVECRSVGIL